MIIHRRLWLPAYQLGLRLRALPFSVSKLRRGQSDAYLILYLRRRHSHRLTAGAVHLVLFSLCDFLCLYRNLIVNIFSSKTNCLNFIFYRFPWRDERILPAWLTVCPPRQRNISRSASMCSHHFSEDCFSKV
jgi:hypothetical protein